MKMGQKTWVVAWAVLVLAAAGWRLRGSGTPSPAEPEANKTKAVSDHIEVAQSDVFL